MQISRREFLQFLGVSSLALVSGCGKPCDSEEPWGEKLGQNSPNATTLDNPIPKGDSTTTAFTSSFIDDVSLLDTLTYAVLISWGDRLNKHWDFGYNNDFIALQALDEQTALMWVNHEYPLPQLMGGIERTRRNIDTERQVVGGSFCKIQQLAGEWTVVVDDPLNGAVRGTTPIPFANGETIAGSTHAMGTIANCAGGQTPWKTFLTCEENYHLFYGERRSNAKRSRSRLGWEHHYPHPPEHYGWIVEVDPANGTAQKHVALGRFAHESATCIATAVDTVVVYSADDKDQEHLYKFVGQPGAKLASGTLYVADMEQGRWLPLDWHKNPVLQAEFASQTELLIHTRRAAKLVGATPLNRPEDIAIHPSTGDVYVALTGSKRLKDPFGSIVRISEQAGDSANLNFTHTTQYLGGLNLGFACPDNLSFDSAGNLWVCTDIAGSAMNKPPYLWVCTDIAGSAMNKPPYESFARNGIFVIPSSGPKAGQAIQVAAAPIDAEFTGLCFSPDEKTIFVSVQHPGEQTTDPTQPTSRWPDRSGPKPAVITIGGTGLANGVGPFVANL